VDDRTARSAQFHLHLFEDLSGSRGPDGYQWPITVPPTVLLGAAVVLAWPNVAITIALLFITLWLSWRRGFWPLEMISATPDASLVTALRQRFPRRG